MASEAHTGQLVSKCIGPATTHSGQTVPRGGPGDDRGCFVNLTPLGPLHVEVASHVHDRVLTQRGFVRGRHIELGFMAAIRSVARPTPGHPEPKLSHASVG